MRKAIDRLFLTGLQIVGLSLALMSVSAVEVRAQTAWCSTIGEPISCYGTGGDSAVATGNPAEASGGNGGDATGPGDIGYGGPGGSATAIATDSVARGDVSVSASAIGGAGGLGYGNSDYFMYGYGGTGGAATADATGSSGTGNVTVSASATGGAGGFWYGQGGNASASSTATTGGPGGASALATATGGEYGWPFEDVFYSGADATATAEADFGGVSVKATAVASSLNALPKTPPTASASALAIALPDKFDAAALIGLGTEVADALLGPGDMVFGIAILGGNDVTNVSATFDFTYRGDLLLGLIDTDRVIDLGSSLGPNVDLTLSGWGAIVIGGAVPQIPTWVMMLIGFAGLGFVGYRNMRKTAAVGLPA